MRHFTDYSVIVTGASSGIGAATAQAFAREGARVVLAGRRLDRLRDLERRMLPFNPRVHAHRIDIRDDTAVLELMADTVRRFGRIDILVNNAGVLVAGGTLDLEGAAVDEMFSVNVRALLSCSRAAAYHMRARGYGHIVNISSIAGHLSVPPKGIYAATKHAVQALSEAMRVEARGDGIRVTTICPGPVATEIGQRGSLRVARRTGRWATTAHGAADRIVDAVRDERREAFIPAALGVAPLLQALAPGAVASIAYRSARLARRWGTGERGSSARRQRLR